MIVIYWVHITFIKINVLLYSGIQDVIISVIIFILINKFIMKNFLNNTEKILIPIILFQLGYNLIISIPTIIDRSLSFYLLEKINKINGINKNDVEGLIRNEYLKEMRVAEMRITEQINSGTLELKNNCIKLTKTGKNVTDISSFIRKNFLPKKRLIGSEYSENLPKDFTGSSEKGCE